MVREKVLWKVSNYLFKVSLTWIIRYDLKNDGQETKTEIKDLL